VRDNERGVIGLEFGKKIYKNYFFIQTESSHESNRPQLKLGSFNYRARLARAKLAQVILAQARLARARAEPRSRAFLCNTNPRCSLSIRKKREEEVERKIREKIKRRKN
jgi:hypothetical protein